MQAYGAGGGYGAAPVHPMVAALAQHVMRLRGLRQRRPVPRGSGRLMPLPHPVMDGAVQGNDPLGVLQNVQSGKTLTDVNYIPTNLAGYPGFEPANSATPAAGWQDMVQNPGAEPDPMGGIRDRLLHGFNHATPALTSRAALFQHLRQAGQRRVMPTRRPILPQRRPVPPQRRAVQY